MNADASANTHHIKFQLGFDDSNETKYACDDLKEAGFLPLEGKLALFETGSGVDQPVSNFKSVAWTCQTVDDQACKDAGGTWRQFTSPCDDACTTGDVCAQVMVDPYYACDCGSDKCWDDDQQACVAESQDNDGDGYRPDGSDYHDCNDNDPNINPGADEICTDNVDNDCDSQIDCDDSDCADHSDCGGGDQEICDNGSDDDGDGQVDCADSDCADHSACQTSDHTLDIHLKLAGVPRVSRDRHEKILEIYSPKKAQYDATKDVVYPGGDSFQAAISFQPKSTAFEDGSQTFGPTYGTTLEEFVYQPDPNGDGQDDDGYYRLAEPLDLSEFAGEEYWNILIEDYATSHPNDSSQLLPLSRHRRVRYCQQDQQTIGQCAYDQWIQIPADPDDNMVLNFIQAPLPAGDVLGIGEVDGQPVASTETDNQINTFDYSYVLSCLGQDVEDDTVDPGCIYRADFNYDHKVNYVDLGLLQEAVDSIPDDV
jgi:hypothetical protein